MKNLILSYSGRKHLAVVAGAPAVDITGLSTGYPQEEKLALHNVSCKVEAGKCVAIVGANGAGKSTLLKVIAGLLPIRHGTVRVYGNSLGACHHRVVYLPQRSGVDWHFPLNVRELVLTGRYVHLGWLAKPSVEDLRKVEEALKSLDIDNLADRQIAQLSGGQQQRVLLARALVQEGDLFLLDEPLNAIDVDTRAVIANLLLDLRKRKKTVLVATHYVDKITKEYDEAIYLHDGEQIDPSKSQFKDREGHGECCS